MKLFEPAFPKPILITEPVYFEHDDEWLNDNPLIQALEVKDTEQIMKDVEYIPTMQSNLSSLKGVFQKTVLRRLSCINVIHPWTSSLYEDILSAILFGYINRDPRRPEIRRFQRELSDTARLKNRDEIYNRIFLSPLSPLTTTSNSVVTGPSGSGKTTTVRRTLLTIPQVIVHPSFGDTPEKHTQIVWLSFDMPASDSPKALALAFFKSIDSAVGTSYFEEWKNRKSDSIEHHYAAMQLLIVKYSVGFVHIDELQFMVKFGSGRNSITLQAIEALFNKLSIPTLTSCTPEGLELFDAQPAEFDDEFDVITTTRRVYSDQIYVFELAPIDSDLFEDLFDAFFPPALSQCGKGFSGEFKIKVATLSAGLLAIITRLAQLYHRIALTVDDLSEEELLEAIFIEQFGPLADALRKLHETGDEKLLEKILSKDDANNAIWSVEEKKGKSVKKRIEVPDISHEYN